jgi:Zn-dependent protease with chaperone function
MSSQPGELVPKPNSALVGSTEAGSGAARIPARLFGPGLPVAGQDVWVRADGSALVVESPALPLPCDAVRLGRAGFDLKGWELSWKTAEGVYALQVLAPASASVLASLLPPSLARQLQAHLQGHRRGRMTRLLGWTALGIFVSFPLLLLAAFLVWSDAVAGWIAEKIPWEQECKIGELGFAQMKTGLKLRDDTECARLLRELGGKLTQGSRYSYRFHLVDKAEINAFAMPGGIVVVNTGLVAATRRPEELAGVLAHEIQHVELRHSLKGIIKHSGLSGLWMFATGDIGSGMAGDAATRVLSLRFSREAEREADTRGLELLHRAGIDPSGMPDFFGMLARKSGSLPALMSTHPVSSEREQTLRAKIGALPQKPTAPLPWSPWPPAM